MMNSIYYLTNKEKIRLFKEVKRCLKPNKFFLFNIENSLYWRNTHPYFPPFPGLWLLPSLVSRKLLSKKGFRNKLSKFNLHHHTSSFNYINLLKKVKPKSINLLLNNSLEYTVPLSDHASLPFPCNDDCSTVTRFSSNSTLKNQFDTYANGHYVDNLYSKLSKLLIKLNLQNLAILTAPRIIFMVKF